MKITKNNIVRVLTSIIMIFRAIDLLLSRLVELSAVTMMLLLKKIRLNQL